MPKTDVIFYRDAKGSSPVVEWQRVLRKTDSIAWANCVARIQLLAEAGHELRRLARMNILTKRRVRVAKTKNALKILNAMIGDDSELRDSVVEASLNARVAQLIYQARGEAGLSQTELAERVGTKQPVIARLEGADYEGHSLSMLQKIAVALGKRLRLSLGPLEKDGALIVKVAPSGASRKVTQKKATATKSAASSRVKGKQQRRA